MSVRFEVLACEQCGTLDPGGRRYCATCGADAMVPRPVVGDGTLVSWTLIRRPPEGYTGDGPFAVALVDLHEGVRISARLNLGEHAAEPALGTGVRVVGIDHGTPIVKPG